ncbi:MAG TPA: hypothetical protein VH107_11810, partial [Lacipirellulaceae bacterium]|nr:hypothetical protein [Lacipirellulaceae bacterium]
MSLIRGEFRSVDTRLDHLNNGDIDRCSTARKAFQSQPSDTEPLLTNFIAKNDPAVWEAIDHEIERQADGLELIASENYTSPAVMQAAGSVLTNKYAEGYPGR